LKIWFSPSNKMRPSVPKRPGCVVAIPLGSQDRVTVRVEERHARLLDRAVAIAAPVHRAVVVETTEALRRHRSLERLVCRELVRRGLRASCVARERDRRA
jgi:hypothetical protein